MFCCCCYDDDDDYNNNNIIINAGIPSVQSRLLPRVCTYKVKVEITPRQTVSVLDGVCGKAMPFSTLHWVGKSFVKLSTIVQQRFTLVHTVNNLYWCTCSYLEYQSGGVCQLRGSGACLDNDVTLVSFG